MQTDYYNHTEKYYINSQKYNECQLVTAINAAICLDEPPVLQNSAEYERLVDITCGRYGACLKIDIAWNYLRLKVSHIEFCWKNVKKYLKDEVINRRNPIGFSVYHRKLGRHSVLAIDCKEQKKTRYIKVLNFTVAVQDGWISWKRFIKYIKDCNAGKLPKTFKMFSLDPWYIRHCQIEYNKTILKGTKR
jgi:hypothetical protein